MKSARAIILYAFLLVITPCTLTFSYEIPAVGTYPGDYDLDGIEDGRDLAELVGQWLQYPGDPNADIAPEGGDGIVNFLDFSVLAKDWSMDSALAAARSGFECGKYLAASDSLINTPNNYVTTEEANDTWTALCQHVQDEAIGGQPDPPGFVYRQTAVLGLPVVKRAVAYAVLATQLCHTYASFCLL